MASFQIHEDTENIMEVNMQVKQEVVGKKANNIKRVAFVALNNFETSEPKRAKLCKATKILPPVKELEHKGLENDEVLDVAVLKPTNRNVENRKPVKLEMFPNSLVYNEEYKQEVWVHLKNLEAIYEWPKDNYMQKQATLNYNMRSILVDWLVAVADEYKLHEQTVHLAVNYIDRFLSHMAVVRDKFQLLGAAAMMIAGKIEEIYPPQIKEWCHLTGNSYTTSQMHRMEELILKRLKFDLQPPTMLSFIQHMCVEHDLDKKTMFLAMYFSELILLEGNHYLRHVPSKLAAASIVLARITLRQRNPWPEKIARSTGYSLKQLSPVVKRQNVTFRDSPTKPHQAIQSKYEGYKYCRVAKIKARALNLTDFEEEE